MQMYLCKYMCSVLQRGGRMNHTTLLRAGRWLAAALALAGSLLAPAAAPAAQAPTAAVQAKILAVVAAPQRARPYFVRDKTIRPGSCGLAYSYTRAAASLPESRLGKSKLRPAASWALQRAARRGARQSNGTTKAAAPEVLDQLRTLLRTVRREEGRAVRGGSAASLRAIAHIEANPGIQVGSLARELGIHQSTASNLLDRLAREGLVAKRRAVEDHRTVSLHVTAKGRLAIKALPPGGAGRLERALARLPAASLLALNEHLKGLVAALKPEGPVQA